MSLSKEEIKIEWEMWEVKPWHCPKCNMLLSTELYSECDGTDPEIPEDCWTPHEKIITTESVSYEKFSEILIGWNKEYQEPK